MTSRWARVSRLVRRQSTWALPARGELVATTSAAAARSKVTGKGSAAVNMAQSTPGQASGVAGEIKEAGSSTRSFGELRRRDLVRKCEFNYGAVPQELSPLFPDVALRDLSNNSVSIHDKLVKAKATILLVSNSNTALRAFKDWCTPYKRQFVDHPDVQVLELTVNSTLYELASSPWTTKSIQRIVPEKRFDNHLIYNGRSEELTSLLASNEQGLVLLMDAGARIRWSGGAVSSLDELVKFSNAVLQTLNEADAPKKSTRFAVCPP